MRIVHYIFFAILIILLSFVFDYHKTTQLKPQSSHAWRQSDCASFALNYYNYNRFITHPRLHNRLEGDGYMVGEFTGLYYISAQLYKVFGVHDFIPRFLNLLIFFLGLFALFKMTYDVTNSIFFAYIIPLLFFSAPVLTFYGNNFLPDVPSFSFILMGWAAFMSYFKHEKLSSLYLMGFFFLMAGLLKITMLVSVVGLGCIFLLEWVGWAHFKKDEKIFKDTWHAFGIFAAIVGLVVLWYVFSHLYNEKHDVAYFLSSTKAAWQTDRMDWFTYTIYRVLYFWSGYYFFTLTHYLIIFLSFWVLLGKKYVGHFLYTMTLMSFLGAFMVFQLWFYQYMNHDYYVIPGYMFVVFLFLSAIVLFKKHFHHIYNSVIFKVIVVGFLALNILHARSTMHDRYAGKLQVKHNDALYEDEFQSYLKKQGIDEHDLVVSVPDKSPNVTLYLMNRPGFTNWVGVSYSDMTEGHLKGFMRRGAHYLIVHDKEYLKSENIKNFKEYEVGDYKGIKIFNLKPYLSE